jgi:hypothetical protein
MFNIECSLRRRKMRSRAAIDRAPFACGQNTIDGDGKIKQMLALGRDN